MNEGREQITKMKKGRSASDANTDRLDADNCACVEYEYRMKLLPYCTLSKGTEIPTDLPPDKASMKLN